MKLFVCLLTFLFGIVVFAKASSAACYTMEQAEAEQGLRIHSELMVIGLNCRHLYSAYPEDLYQKYKRFTSNNGVLFADYEQKLYSFFSQQGKDPDASINALRTGYANKISSDAATMRPDLFCRMYAPRIDKAMTMSTAEIRKWASTFFPSHPVKYPLCNG